MKRRFGVFHMIKEYYGNAFTLKGRSNQKEYWSAFIMNIVLEILMYLFYGAFMIAFTMGFYALFGPEDGQVGSTLPLIYALLFLRFIFSIWIWYPFIALSVRRLHDIGASGYFVLIAIGILFLTFFVSFGMFFTTVGMPIILICIIVLGCLDSQHGPNKWGEPVGEVKVGE
ncbi:DUF805 domain-containing protein [Macrococcus capreoli]|uniref:DUF805 domain-containing protein n=1 Tax=Macrococcus capreoli TaxID=2982690 RepID=UPI003EE5059F